MTANRHGQQLWFADLAGFAKRKRANQIQPVIREFRSAASRSAHRLTLFPMIHDLAAAGRAGMHRRGDPEQTRDLEDLANTTAASNGWDAGLLSDTRIGLRIMIGLLDDGATTVSSSQVDQLRTIDLTVWSVRQVLQDAGRLDEDRTTALDRYFTQHTRQLPEPMLTELATWFDIMKNGVATAPRRRPRSDGTTSLHLRWALPVLHVWADDGHTSLREITRDALPASGNPRSTTGQGLKSVFRLLKARKVLFTDPTSRVKTGGHASRQPVPIDLIKLKEALNSPHPARALVVALIAFHGLRLGHLQRLHLTDHRDGRLHVDGRVILLAEPVQERLTTYLTYRADTWPHSVNPHLLIHRRSADRLERVGKRWIWLAVGPGLSPSTIREDRILSEAHATGGDVRRLADFFGLSINAGGRYAATLDHEDFHTLSSRTPDPT